jgi:hypothetical protein
LQIEANGALIRESGTEADPSKLLERAAEARRGAPSKLD